MGNFQSIFYPDNPDRRKRVQQLSDDCTFSKQQYNATKTQLANELGPYKEKLDKLLQAFNCANIADLDKLIQSSITGKDLEHWNHVLKVYDDSEVVDEVLAGIQGVVLVTGISISVIGSIAGGIGFFAGLGVTAEIELILGAIEIIYDLIDGAIQREKLRHAINVLVPCRMKAKFVERQMDELYKRVPAIKDLYDICEKLGYDKDKIMKVMKDGDITKSLQQHSASITYEEVGQELANMDSGRGSWTNEDPDWHPIARSLETDYLKRIVDGNRTLSGPSPEAMKAQELWVGPNPPLDAKIKMQLQNPAADILKQPLHVLLTSFDTSNSARVTISSADDKQTLVVDSESWVVSMKDSSQIADTEAPHWIMSFVNPSDGPLFSTAGPSWDPSKTPKMVEVYVRLVISGVSPDGFPYLVNVGKVIQNEGGSPASHLAVSYVSH